VTVSDGTARYARIHDGTADAARAIAVPTRACCITMLHVVSWLVCCMLYVASGRQVARLALGQHRAATVVVLNRMVRRAQQTNNQTRSSARRTNKTA
jgi:hypothetical protein